MKYYFYLFILIFALALPCYVHADIFITEIMYDNSGSDTGREWIEIFNSGGELVDITGWKFFDDSNHVLNEPPKNASRGSLLLSSGAYIILTGDASLFILENSSYSGSVIDTVMSLKNTSGQVGILNAEGTEVDKVLYGQEIGANGDGNSLQKTSSGWTASSPTLGSSAFSISINQNNNSNNSSNQNISSNQATSSNNTRPDLRPQMYAFAGEDKTVIVGADTFFEGKAFGLENKKLENADFLWNFGDGSIKKGEKVLHSYNYPGKYVIFLDVSSGEFSTTDRINVNALPADIIISNIGRTDKDNFVEIYNKTNRELDLSWWRLQVDNNFFTLPKNTIILPNQKIIFSKNTTNLITKENSIVNLLYPNGSLAVSFNKNEDIGSKISYQNSNVTQTNKNLLNLNEEANKSINIVTEIEENSNEMNSSASVINSEIIENTASNKDIFKWVIALFSVILLSIVSYLYVRKNSTRGEQKDQEDIEKISNEIEIFESPH